MIKILIITDVIIVSLVAFMFVKYKNSALPTIHSIHKVADAQISTSTAQRLQSQGDISTTSTQQNNVGIKPNIKPGGQVQSERKRLVSMIHISSQIRLISILKKIVQCESGGDPHARNPGSSAKGLLQILDGTWSAFQCDGNVFNPVDNFSCGLKIATQSGLQHWQPSEFCWKGAIAKSVALDNASTSAAVPVLTVGMSSGQ